MHGLLNIIGLGVLGIDPVGALLVASAVASRAERLKVLLFAVTAVVGTALLGTALSLLGDGAMRFVESALPEDHSPVWAVTNVVVITVIIVWLARRFVKRNEVGDDEEGGRRLLGGSWQFIATGLLFAVSALADPTFYAAAVIAAEASNVVTMFALNLTWIVISQALLVAVVVAYYLNAHAALLAFGERLWARHKSKAVTVLYAAALVLAVVLLIDTVIFVFTDAYLF